MGGEEVSEISLRSAMWFAMATKAGGLLGIFAFKFKLFRDTNLSYGLLDEADFKWKMNKGTLFV